MAQLHDPDADDLDTISMLGNQDITGDLLPVLAGIEADIEAGKPLVEPGTHRPLDEFCVEELLRLHVEFQKAVQKGYGDFLLITDQ